MSLLPLSTSIAPPKNACLSKGGNAPLSNTSARRPSYISCKQQPPPEKNPNNGTNIIDRRNVLLGLSGIYGATATLGSTAFANPVQPPDLGKCHLATDKNICDEKYRQVECCPPKYESTQINDFKHPKFNCLRIRQPAHKLGTEYIAKYEEAIRRMKALPEDDPWNFYQQAQIHCAFCNGAYDQFSYPGTLLQVHLSYLFLPWHRFYVLFWERILGKLIDDPTFAIPYWSWDTPSGMYLPPIYKDPNSPLYNDNRNHDHDKALLDFKYKAGDANPTPDQKDAVILGNLLKIEMMFTAGKICPFLFMGGREVAGEAVDGTKEMGALEGLHNTVHQWVGPITKPNWDMGDFHTAAKDTVFWGHHGNVDRMWYLLTSFRGNKPEFKTKDWLDASFIFYDENRQLVKCKVRDGLDITKLGYTYQTEELPWLNARRSYIKVQRAREKSEVKKADLIEVGEFGSTPQVLRENIRVLVPRPKTSLSKDDKEEVSEVLTIENIEITNDTEHQRFDVYISKPVDGKATSDLGEFAGTFTYIPISSDKRKILLNLGITSVVEILEADALEYLVVSLIPGVGEVTIGGVKIFHCLLDIIHGVGDGDGDGDGDADGE